MADGSLKVPSCLGDLRVLELADEKVQYAGKLCGDFGADVIAIEPPEGSTARRIGPFVDDIPNVNRSLSFWHYNTSKRSITLSLRDPEGQRIFKRLAATADVLLEGERPGLLAGLGLGYEEISRNNPKLIMVSVTPFGQDGPWRDLKGSDLVHLALGGPMHSTGYSDPAETPIAGGGGQAYHIAGNWAFIALLLAVAERDRSRQGQYLDISVHEACSICTEFAIPTWMYRRKVLLRHTGAHAQQERRASNQFRCADGTYLSLALPLMDLTQWRTIVGRLDSKGAAEDLKDTAYDDYMYRVQHQQHIYGVFRQFIEANSSEEMYYGAQLRHLTWGQIRAPEENLEDLHFQDRGFWHQVEHPEVGRAFTYPGGAFNPPEAPWRIWRRPPLLGEHNVEVYCQELGYSRTQLAHLREQGVV